MDKTWAVTFLDNPSSVGLTNKGHQTCSIDGCWPTALAVPLLVLGGADIPGHGVSQPVSQGRQNPAGVAVKEVKRKLGFNGLNSEE